MSNSIFLHFLGASETVTGSKYLIEYNNNKILVDCGLFQGLKELRLLNWNAPPVDVSSIDYVLLTHGHLDHSGYLPRLIKYGFKGKIYGTPPTLAIAEIILKDSAKIQEEEAENANKYGYTKHHPAKPLYTLKDVEQTIPLFNSINVNEWIKINEEIKMRFSNNGHILGSCYVELMIKDKVIVFSGDVGDESDLLLYPPIKPKKADIVLIESTYGDRLHPKHNIQDILKDIILKTIHKGGSVIIPSFAVERTQSLMYMIWQLRKNGELPDIPFIIDSPMGANVLEVFNTYKSWHKINDDDFSAMCNVFNIVQDYQETKAYIASPYPKVVIAGSGMITGGRVLSYLKEYISNPVHTLLFVGFQGEGTRGRQIIEGAHEVKIHGKYYPVKCTIENIQGLSAHADQAGLLNWLSEIKNKPEKVYVIHGEKQAANVFRVKIQDSLGWEAVVPHLYQIDEIICN